MAAKPKYNGFPHWSKIEIGDYGLAESHDDLGSDELSERVANFRARYAARFPTEAFEQVRHTVLCDRASCILEVYLIGPSYRLLPGPVHARPERNFEQSYYSIIAELQSCGYCARI